MDQKLDILEKKVLVGIVKMVQKQGMQGTAGGWKDFLNSYDKKFGSSLSDPARRSNDVLVSFLKTFTKDDDLKFIAKVLQRHQNRDILELYEKNSPDDVSPEQRLVRLTLQHPEYALNYMFPSCNEEWVVTKIGEKSKVMTSNKMYAVDCEMVLCEDGSEALVRVCVVDRNLEVKLDELVNPNKAVADYRSEITGVTPGDLVGVTCSLADIQKRMTKLLSHGVILVGHSLNNDLQALKIDHPRVIDTSLIFKYSDGNRRPSLNNLCKSVLGYEIRNNGAPHNCLDDACAAMKLVLAAIERGVDNNMAIVQEDVPEIDKEKLLIHRIPVNVPSEELRRVIPGEFTMEVKPSKRLQGDKYSVVAIFSSPQEACQAFENVEGSLEKDSSGRQQKLVDFQTSKGVICGIYVRKMVRDVPLGQFLVKRALEGEENSGVSKKRKIELINKEIVSKPNECRCEEHLKEIERLRKMVDSNQCKDHLKEIERLKQELIERDFQISKQHKMISVLKQKSQNKKDRKKKR